MTTTKPLAGASTGDLRGAVTDLDMLIVAEHTRLVGLLALHVGNRAVAEELAQDALVRLCEHWPRVRQMDDPRAWLRRVGINLANSRLRRRYAERRAMTRHGPDPVTAGRDEPADVLAVRRAVAALPRRQRTALVLRFFVDLSVRETADLMACAEGTVKSLTHHAITRLRDEAGLFEGDEQ